MDKKGIDKIQEIRKKNNGNWMDLVRLALEVAPERTKAIMRKIVVCDKEVTSVVEELLDG